MDTSDSLEAKCEHLMNIVVESRKRFGKTCQDYDQKILLMENKLLNLQVETVSNYRFKPKNPLPSVNHDSANDLDDFLIEITEKHKRIESLKKRLKNTQDVISQIETDGMGKKLRVPLTADALLAQAKSKNVNKI